jgi:hypothetical protein
MTGLAQTRLQPNEPENVRRPKLQRMLDHLLAAEQVTLDPAVAALAAISPAANQIVYWTGAAAAAATAISPFGRSLIDDADAAAARGTIGAEPAIATGTAGQYWRHDKSWAALDVAAVAGLPAALAAKLDDAQAGATGLSLLGAANAATARAALGLVIGTDVQGFDPQLAAMAGLAPASDQIIYWTGAATAAMAALTPAARTLLAQASQSAMRSTGLGLAAIAASGSGADLANASVTLAKLASLPATTLIGNVGGAPGAPAGLSAAQAKALLAIAAPADISGLAAVATSGLAADLPDALTRGLVLPLAVSLVLN